MKNQKGRIGERVRGRFNPEPWNLGTWDLEFGIWNLVLGPWKFFVDLLQGLFDDARSRFNHDVSSFGL